MFSNTGNKYNQILFLTALGCLVNIFPTAVFASEALGPRQTYENSHPDHGLGPDLKSQRLIEEKIEGSHARCRYEAIMKNGKIFYPFAILTKDPNGEWHASSYGCSSENYKNQLCLNKSPWLLATDSMPFSRKSLTGQMMGHEYRNESCKIIHIGNSIEIEFSDNHKSNPTKILLALKQDEGSAKDLKCSANAYESKTISWISVNGRTFSLGDFGLHLSVGKKNETGYTPIFIVLRFNDELKSHIEGCCYASNQ